MTPGEIDTSGGVSRRGFMLSAAGLAIAASSTGAAFAQTAQSSSMDDPARRDGAFMTRLSAASHWRDEPYLPHPDNGDEALYANRRASFTKCLPHNSLGDVDVSAYDMLRDALLAGDALAIERVPLAGDRKFASPMAAFKYPMGGPDGHQLTIPPAPVFAGAEAAGEMVELYWHALLRDVAFTDFETNPLVATACADLNALSDFRGPKQGGVVTPLTLFRGPTPGDLAGPYLSQFLLVDVPHGASIAPQRIQVPMAGTDRIFDSIDWINVLLGGAARFPLFFDDVRRHIRNGRDLGEYVHRDYPSMTYVHAALILLYHSANLNRTNPYLRSRTQEEFATFGVAQFIELINTAAHAAICAAWCQKWLVHRRLRPEVFGGRIQNLLMGDSDDPIHTDALNSRALEENFLRFQSYYLPQAYSEGSPVHPSYPAGHAVIAGACVTILKALFDEAQVVPRPLVPNAAGTGLVPYAGGDVLTVGGEFNKLASNISLGRDFAGVHYRSDGIEGMRLGEQVGLGILHDVRTTVAEPFPGFRLTKFDGSVVEV